MSTTPPLLSTSETLLINDLRSTLRSMARKTRTRGSRKEDKKSVQKVSNGISASPRGKNHSDYWLHKIFRPKYKTEDGHKQTATYSVKLQFNKRRELFPLNESVAGLAAMKAKKIWASLISVGWDATLREFKPHSVFIPPTFETIDEYIGFLREKKFYPESTLNRKLTKMDTALAEMFQFPKTKKRYDARKSGLRDWREKIRAVRWSSITPLKIEEWKNNYLAARSKDHKQRTAAEHTLDGYIRTLKSLFGQKIRKRLAAFEIVLPSPIPFENTMFVSRGKSAFRYRSRMDPYALTAAAVGELRGNRSEELKAFLLALHLGLRRNEIDKLNWSQFDFVKGVLQVESTEYIQLKTPGSECDIWLEPQLADYFKKAQEAATGIFVIESKVKPRKTTGWAHYRANNVFTDLIVWLRSKGIKAQKPLHTLRKEFGRLITEKMGIFAASLGLRHSSPGVTAIYYADDTRPKHTGLGETLGNTLANRDSAAGRN